MSVDNSAFVKKSQAILKELGAEVKTTQLYELFARLQGEKNWNTAKPKGKLFSEVILGLAPHKERKIPTGHTELDKTLLGGLTRGSVCTVMGKNSVGKSIFVMNLGAKALSLKDKSGKSLGLKVLHINLERGPWLGVEMKYQSNISGVSFKSISSQNLSNDQQKEIDQVSRDTYGNLIVRSMMGFGVTIEEVERYAEETYKDFQFDMVIVDYAQLLSSRDHDIDSQTGLARVFRGLGALAKKFDCVVVTPHQVNQESDLEDPIRALNSSETMDAARVSHTILTLNRNEEDAQNNQMKIYLEKNRDGEFNKTFITNADFSKMNLLL